MKIVNDIVLKRLSADRKKLKVLMKKREELQWVLDARRVDIRGVEQIDDKVRKLDRQIKFACDALIRSYVVDILDEDETSMASSSNSECPEDETSSSKLHGEGQKKTVIGQGGNGPTEINNWNSKIEFRYEKVQFIKKNYYQNTRSKRKE